VQRILCAGIPAERHGDRAAHDLRVASRLSTVLEPSLQQPDEACGQEQGHAAIDDNRHHKLR
jgi:hypothetical protein